MESARAPIGLSAPAAEPRAERRGRILIVDDEPMIGRVMQRALASEHDVTLVEHGQEALDLVKAGQSFDIIFCDLMMPQMTGMDLYDHLAKVRSDLTARMIFVTGGTFTARAREFLEQVPNPRIEKPFHIKQLRALVNGRLG